MTVSENLISAWAERIADDLVGTCTGDIERSIEELLGEDYLWLADNERFLQCLDEQVFQCANCGWWCPIEEVNEVDGELICDDCMDEE